MSKIKLHKNTVALEYQYDEVLQFNKADKVLSSTKFDTAEEAKEAFQEQMRELNMAEEVRIEFVQPRFVSQRLLIERKEKV